jgi:hypothetical protein
MKCVLFFISYLGSLFLASQGFTDAISHEPPSLSNENLQEKQEKEAKNSNDSNIESHVLPDGRKVLRIKNGMNDQQSIIETDSSGNMEEIIKTISSKSRKMEGQKGQQVINHGYVPRYHQLDKRIEAIQGFEENETTDPEDGAHDPRPLPNPTG